MRLEVSGCGLAEGMLDDGDLVARGMVSGVARRTEKPCCPV